MFAPKHLLTLPLLLAMLLGSQSILGQSIDTHLEGIEIKPIPKIIRRCCNFGYGAPVFWMPVNMGYITAPHLLGKHVFYGDEQEGNGIIYSNHGGFLDLGHIRDHADLVAYFAFHINNSIGKDTVINTIREGGAREIHLHLANADLSEDDIVRIAQRMSYDMGVWHEIRTYFGVSTYWPIHEKQSAFSPEDNYSNLLGTHIGFRAMTEPGRFEENVEREIKEVMLSCEAVATSEETRKAMDDVRGLWWRKVSLPSNRFLLAKYFDTYDSLTPWTIPSHSEFFDTPADLVDLEVPQNTESGVPLTDYFTIEIHPVPDVPVKKVLNRKRREGITEDDFPIFVQWIRNNEADQDLGKKPVPETKNISATGKKTPSISH